MHFFIQVHTCCSAHTPYLPEVLQRGRGRTRRRERDRGDEEEVKGEGELVGGEWGSADVMIGEMRRRKKEGMLGDGELTMMVIQEEEKRENGEGCYLLHE